VNQAFVAAAVVLGASLAACARERTVAPVQPAPPVYAPAPAPPQADPELSAAQAEMGPLDPRDLGQRVLLAGQKIAFVEKRIIKGGCWDFVNAVYTEAGFVQKQRRVVFQGKRQGPYAKADVLRPGDWIMHVNLEAGRVEHSGIFVKWADRARRVALALDYAGNSRPTPGRLSRHEYSQVFTVLRPKAEK